MKILQLVQRPQRRGAELFALQLSQTLEARGHQSPIAYLYPVTGSQALELRGQDRVLATEERPAAERLGFDLRLLTSLRRCVEEIQPDVVQLNGARTVKYGTLLARLTPGRRWALLCRSIGDPAAWVRGRARRLAFRHLVIPTMDGLVAVSRATLDRLRLFYGQDIPAVSIPRGVDFARLEPTRQRQEVRSLLGCPTDAPVLIAVGALGPEKRLDRSLALAQDLAERYPDLELWLVGDGPLREQLETEASERGISKRVRFLGIQADVGDFLNAADLLLLTSDTEGIPGVVLEAGHLRLPVVATSVGGVPECVSDGETGLLVEPGDHLALVVAVRTLLDAPGLRARLGAEARRRVYGGFAIGRIAEAYLDVYGQLTAASREGSGDLAPPECLRLGPKPRYRVLFVIEGLGQGGTERSVAEGLAPLRELGIETTVACFHRRSGALEGVLAHGFEVRILPGGWLRRWWSLRGLIRRLRPSIIHTALPRTDILGRLAAIGSGVPVLSSIVSARYGRARTADPHLRNSLFRLVKWVDGYTARHHCDHFHAVSEAAKADAVDALGIAPDHVSTIPRGRSAARLGQPSEDRKRCARESLGVAGNQPVLVNLGRHVYAKGHLYLLEAASRLRRAYPGLQVLIAGQRGPQTPELEEAIARQGLEESVRLLGYRRDAPEVLAAADLFVFTSLYEGMPGAVIEALALGLPIVAFDIPPVRETVAEGENALLVPTGDTAQLVSAIERLLGDKALAREMALRNRALFEQRFTLETSVRSLAALYESLAQPHLQEGRVAR